MAEKSRSFVTPSSGLGNTKLEMTRGLAKATPPTVEMPSAYLAGVCRIKGWLMDPQVGLSML
jgi:hypothetical protein